MSGLILVIVDNLTTKNEESSNLKAAKVIERDIKDLVRYALAS